MREVLGALGLAWPRLLIYPGGLLALLGAWLLARTTAGRSAFGIPPLLSCFLLDLLPPLAGLSLLPLPPARAFPYGLDLPLALALFGWPRLRRLAAGGWLAPARLAALAPGGGLLLGAVMALAEGAGSLELSALLRAPEPAWRWAPLLGGGLAWLAGGVLLPEGEAGAGGHGAGAGLRSGGPGYWLGELGLLAVGALPLLAGLAALLADRLPRGWAGWLLPPIALVTAALMRGGVRRLRQR